MAQNVEIKARSVDFAGQMEIARCLSGAEPKVIHQEDVFFNVSMGRLKLRVFSPDSGELIFYQRPDRTGPKISQYEISETKDSEGLKRILQKAFGVRNTVIKTRHLYQQGRTRIHLDRVESLGEFIELEVVLSDDDELADGENEAQELMHSLGIKAEHLIELAYVDMLEAKSL